MSRLIKNHFKSYLTENLNLKEDGWLIAEKMLEFLRIPNNLIYDPLGQYYGIFPIINMELNGNLKLNYNCPFIENDNLEEDSNQIFHDEISRAGIWDSNYLETEPYGQIENNLNSFPIFENYEIEEFLENDMDFDLINKCVNEVTNGINLDDEIFISPIKTEPLTKNYYKAIICNINNYQEEDFLKSIKGKFPALLFSYKLESFQLMAISLVEKGKSILVSSPTSSGKSVIAEYAIALSLNQGKRAVYLAPIKSLINQKYRDMKKLFPGKLGVITGDLCLDNSAPLTLQVAEVFRKILIEDQKDFISKLGVLVIDEVHFLGNSQRGYVWEEILLLIPKYVQLILLSGTFENAKDFANWLSQIKGKDTYIIINTKRPISLEYHFFDGKESLLIAKENKVIEKNLTKLIKTKDNRIEKNISLNNIKYLVQKSKAIANFLKKEDQFPCAIFLLSRKMCSLNALKLNLDLTNSEEKKRIRKIIFSTCPDLAIKSQNSKWDARIISQLLNGIGVHHSGLELSVREAAEKLLQEGLLKIVFVTETLAMGINLPFKSILFLSMIRVKKFLISPIEPVTFQQMCGRAGRRGLTKVGNVYIADYNFLSLSRDEILKLLKGNFLIDSKYKLTFSTVIHELTKENSINFSGYNFQNFQRITLLNQKIKLNNGTIDNTMLDCNCEIGENCKRISYATSSKINEFIKLKDLNVYMQKYKNKIAFKPGTIMIKKDGSIFILNNIRKKLMQDGKKNYELEGWKFSVIKNLFKSHQNTCLDIFTSLGFYKIDSIDYNAELTSERLENFSFISSFPLPDDYLRRLKEKNINLKNLKFQRIIEELITSSKFNDEMLLILMKSDCGIDNMSRCCENWVVHMAHFIDKGNYSNDELFSFTEEYKRKILFLERMNYIDQDGNLTYKHKIFMNFNHFDPLIGTEFLLEKAFHQLSPDYVIGLLSIFSGHGKSCDLKKLIYRFPPDLIKISNILQDILKIGEECGLKSNFLNLDLEISDSFLFKMLDFTSRKLRLSKDRLDEMEGLELHEDFGILLKVIDGILKMLTDFIYAGESFDDLKSIKNIIEAKELLENRIIEDDLKF